MLRKEGTREHAQLQSTEGISSTARRGPFSVPGPQATPSTDFASPSRTPRPIFPTPKFTPSEVAPSSRAAGPPPTARRRAPPAAPPRCITWQGTVLTACDRFPPSSYSSGALPPRGRTAISPALRAAAGDRRTPRSPMPPHQARLGDQSQLAAAPHPPPPPTSRLAAPLPATYPAAPPAVAASRRSARSHRTRARPNTWIDRLRPEAR